MAKRQFTVTGIDKLISKLDKLTDIYPVLKASLYDGAGILADEIKKRAPDVVKPSVSISRMNTKNGGVSTAIVFAGYYEKHRTKQFPNGVPYSLLAAVYESGTSERSTANGFNRGKFTKHPFIRPAINACKERAEKAIQEQMDEQINKIMEE